MRWTSPLNRYYVPTQIARDLGKRAGGTKGLVGYSLPAVIGAAGALSSLALGAKRVSDNFLKGLLPNTAYPASSGSYGFRTASDAGPAGLAGLRFNFRRK
jgi:hypothetical protein